MGIDGKMIDNIREYLDIVEYIGERVNLSHRGKNFIGICPFHSEKTPSFSVSPEKKMFYCFGCGKGGDIINFVMEYDGVDFETAVEILDSRDKKVFGFSTSQLSAMISVLEFYETICPDERKKGLQQLLEMYCGIRKETEMILGNGKN